MVQDFRWFSLGCFRTVGSEVVLRFLGSGQGIFREGSYGVVPRVDWVVQDGSSWFCGIIRGIVPGGSICCFGFEKRDFASRVVPGGFRCRSGWF